MHKRISTALAIATTASALMLGAPATFAQDKPMTSPASTAAGAPSSELQIIDVKTGAGPQAEAGKAAMVHYTGWLYDDKAPENKGKQFDSSTGRGLPFGFVVGAGRVIKGWDQGVIGMKVGGKRRLVIPPQLAYGDKNVGSGLIPANSTLVFDVELVEVKP